MELVQSANTNNSQSNTYKTDLNWLHFSSEQEKKEARETFQEKQVQDQQSYIAVSLAYLTHSRSNQEHQPSFHAMLNDRFLEIKQNFRRSLSQVYYMLVKVQMPNPILPQIRCTITLRLESNITSMDHNIIDITIRKIISTQQEKSTTMTGAPKKNSKNMAFLSRFSIQNPPEIICYGDVKK